MEIPPNLLVPYSLYNLSGYMDCSLLVKHLMADIQIEVKTQYLSSWVCVTSLKINFF